MAKELPSLELLHKLLRYEPETGKLYWISDRRNAKAGDEVGSQRKDGYLNVVALGRSYLAHRLAWFLYYGDYPNGQLDHINGIRVDNRILNLRVVFPFENNRNQKRNRRNTSGVCGVSWFKRTLKWRATIQDDNYRFKHLGYFDTLEEAAKARKEAEEKYGFHENHGRD